LQAGNDCRQVCLFDVETQGLNAGFAAEKVEQRRNADGSLPIKADTVARFAAEVFNQPAR